MVAWGCPIKANGKHYCRRLTDCDYKGDEKYLAYNQCHLYDLKWLKD
jgi:hypothetical protein